MDARNIPFRGKEVRVRPSRECGGTGRRTNAGRYNGGRNNGRWTPQIDEKGPKPPQEPLAMEYFESLFKEMLRKEDPETISEAILAQRNLVTNILNEDLTKKVELSGTILKVIVKASSNMKLSKSFRIFLTLVLESHFAKRTIDTLVSVYLPSSRDIGIFADIVSFFKLALELFPGLAYDMFYYRVGNLKMLLGIPYFQAEMSNELSQELDELTVMLASSDPNKAAKDAIFQEKRIETIESEDPLDDFRAKNIFPTTAELLYEKKDIFLRENRSRGAYTSVNEYLDVQFRLMHEDFIQPLREGLREYKDNPNKRNMNIRVYTKVRSLKSHLNPRLGIIHYIQLDQEKLRRIKWSQSKRLLYGSLLCFSSDNFETLIFATVANRDDRDIKEGILAVKFMEKSLSEDEEYTLVESMNMFESYKYVLAKLQATNEGNLPMKKYLVFAERDISPPHYLSRNTCYYLSNCLIRPDPRSSLRWPLPSQLQMNKSQFSAFKSALTKELTIIQGPPGTGKTYLGLKICACLVQNVKNPSSNFGPILVVCYTNHALDQFLEGILTFTDSVVRVGGQSKSQELKKYCLNELKMKEPYNIYKEKKRYIYGNLEYLEESCNTYSNRFNTIINLHSLAPYMSWNHSRFFDNISIESWLSGKDYSIFSSTSSILAEDEVERIMYELIEDTLQEIVLENDHPDPFLNKGDEACEENDSDTEVTYIQGQRILDVDKDDIEKLTSSFRDVMSLSFVKTRLAKRQGRRVKNRLQKTSLVNIKSMTAEDVNAVTDLDGLTLQDRWRLYKYWRHLYVEQSMMRLQRYEQEYEHLSKYLNEVSLDEDKWIMMSKDVIGMTTTGAARYRRVLEKIACKIIIVEEAAEVLESHIIGSLNPGCQHLVLMGDHKQLRPSPAVYQLATKYHLNLSLFERMINNKLDFNSLSVQHRMRPDIADIVRFIYEDLEDSYSVSEYPNVPAMRNNIFFFNHASQEHLNQDLQSYSNRFEADIIVKLCYHMLQNGIEGAKITILTLYSGQLFLLKSLMNKNLFPEVRVCVVDNFQGEENDIILLSLVRSNEEQKIGFVGIDNRICVSLSRAKHGLYVFGDFDLLASRNKLWKKICQSAKEKGFLGGVLDMYCQNHPQKKLLVTTADDFKKYPDSGCEELCQAVLDCGHVCLRYCHFMDRNHEAYLCDFDCDRRCPQGHECKLRCCEDCSHCTVEVEKVIPTCKHIQTMACGQVPRSSDCRSPCERTIPTCGHTCLRRCGEECGRCLTTVSRPSSDCGHLQESPCWQKDPICYRPCDTVLHCGHLCQGTCHSCHMGRLHARCDLRCGRTLMCGHICKRRCSDPCYPCLCQCDDGCWHQKCEDFCMNRCGPCVEPCLWRCPHLHCKMPCQEPCDRGVCNQRCSRPLVCDACGENFLCYGLCGERCRTTCRYCDPEIEVGLCYVTLWTCGHAVEVTVMDSHIQDGKDNHQVQWLSCPRCQMRLSVRSTFRYMNEFRRRSVVVKKIQGLHKDALMSFQYSGFRTTLDGCQDDIQEFLESFEHPNYLFSWERGDYLHDAYFRGSDQDRHIFAYRYQTSLALLRRLFSFKRYISSCSDVKAIRDLISWLDPNIRKFDKAEMEAFNTEYGRIDDLVKKFDYRRYIPPSLRQSNNIVSTCDSIQEKQFYTKDAIWLQCPEGHLFQLGSERDLPICCQIILDSGNLSRDL